MGGVVTSRLLELRDDLAETRRLRRYLANRFAA
jgi:hypothetical protein